MFELRPFQKDAIEALRYPVHYICISATGSGKSLIYERVAARGLRTLLVSPLIALARQQNERLQAAGLKVTLSAGNPESRRPSPETEVWIVSPETLHQKVQAAALSLWRPQFLVVDECHCLWEWGRNFRPAFSALPELIKTHSIGRSLWLTATLPYGARHELRSLLPDPRIEAGEFGLPENLRLHVRRVPWVARGDFLLNWVRRQKEPGIIFAATREGTLRLSRLLSAAGIDAGYYHAGLSREERLAIEARVKSRQCRVLVSTSAFGMGMDYPHLRWTVLWQAPPSLLFLAQAIGRVARGSEGKGDALVLWDSEDFRLLEWGIHDCDRKKQDLLETARFLGLDQCRRSTLGYYFDRKHRDGSCGKCDQCEGRQNPDELSGRLKLLH